MTSFRVECEPRPQPRLAAGALLLHVLAAAWPWAARCPGWLAMPLSLMAILGLVTTIARLPGAHCRLRDLEFRDGSWRARRACDSSAVTVRIGPGTRVFAGLIAVDIHAGRERLGWLLTRSAVDPMQFRRLKARLRLAC